MKRTITVILIAIAALGFTACGSDDSNDPPVTVTVLVPDTTTTTTTVPSLNLEDGFVESVRAFSPELYDVPDYVLIDAGEAICFAFDSGETVESVINTGIDSGLSDESLAAVIGGATVWLCPEYQYLIDTMDAT